MEKFLRKTIRVSPDLDKKIKDISKKTGKSEAQLLREYIERGVRDADVAQQLIEMKELVNQQRYFLDRMQIDHEKHHSNLKVTGEYIHENIKGGVQSIDNKLIDLRKLNFGQTEFLKKEFENKFNSILHKINKETFFSLQTLSSFFKKIIEKSKFMDEIILSKKSSLLVKRKELEEKSTKS